MQILRLPSRLRRRGNAEKSTWQVTWEPSRRLPFYSSGWLRDSWQWAILNSKESTTLKIQQPESSHRPVLDCRSIGGVAMIRGVILVIGGTLLVGGMVAARSAQTPAQPQCSLTDKGRFDLGFTQKTEGGSYRCVATFDQALRPSGAAWVKVNADGTIGRELPR